MKLARSAIAQAGGTGQNLATSTHRMIEGQYFRDILDQPRAVADTLVHLEIGKNAEPLRQGLREGRFHRVVLTGMGASFHALQPLFLHLNAQGFTATRVETSELIHSLDRWLGPETLLVVVSQSGESAEIVRLVEANRNRAPIVGVTNAAASHLARRADVPIVTMAGAESSVSCKTYLTALMALHALGGFLCGAEDSRDELAPLAAAVASYLENWRHHVSEITEMLEGVHNIFLLGRGASLAATGAGSLILKESVRRPAEGMSGGAFRHGPLEMVDASTVALVFAGAVATRTLQSRLAEDIRRAGGRAAWIADDIKHGAWSLPRVPVALLPMLEILPVQMTTLALAAQAGIEAGHFNRISKITTSE